MTGASKPIQNERDRPAALILYRFALTLNGRGPQLPLLQESYGVV